MVHPHWVIPAPGPLVRAAAEADVVVVIEDGLVDGGIGSQLRDAVEDHQTSRPGEAGSPVFRRIGIPRQFIDTASRAELLEDFGMLAADIARTAATAADGVVAVRDLGPSRRATAVRRGFWHARCRPCSRPPLGHLS